MGSPRFSERRPPQNAVHSILGEQEMTGSGVPVVPQPAEKGKGDV
jgi:hypothetical protein